MTASKEFSGKSLDDALNDAAATFGVSKSAVGYNVVPESSAGFFSKLFSRSVKIEAWVDNGQDLQAAARQAVMQALTGKDDSQQQKGNRNRGRNDQNERGGQRPPRNEQPRQARPEQQQQQQQQQQKGRNQPRQENQEGRPPKPQREPRPPREPRERKNESGLPDRPQLTLDSPGVQELLKTYTVEFLKSFEVTEYETSRDENNDQVFDVKDAHIEDILSRSDRLALAFEHVFKRIAQKKIGDVSGRLYLRSGNADDVRNNKVIELAKSMAEKVKATGKTMTLPSRSSQERRIVHTTLKEEPGIGTKSIGTGDNRKLIIFSTDKPRPPRNQQAQSPRPDNNGAEGQPAKRRRRRGGRGRNHNRGEGASAASTAGQPDNSGESVKPAES